MNCAHLKFKIQNSQTKNHQIGKLEVGGWRLWFCKPFFTLLLTFTSLVLHAQLTQPARFEREHKSNEPDFSVISLGETGIALVHDTEKFEGNKKKWEVIFLDTALRESWNTLLEVEQHMTIFGHDYRDGNLYLIFEDTDTNDREINLTEIVFANRTVAHHRFKPEVNIRFTHFSVLRNKALFGGYINTEPTLLMYDMRTESARVIPGLFQKKVELMDMRANSNDTFNALLVDRSLASNKKLVVRTYDAEGVMLVDDIIQMEEGKSIMEAMTSSLVHDELVILGTWTYGLNKQAAGIFSVVVDPFKDQKINYYALTDLNHFLDYLKPKRAARIKAKAMRRKEKGKPAEFRAYLSGEKIEETKEGFGFLVEAYDPSGYYNQGMGYPFSRYGNYPTYYSPYGYSPMNMPMYYNSPYGYTPSSGTYRSRTVTHSAVIFFDARGILAADHSMKFESINQSTQEQVSDFISITNGVAMACKNDEEIIIQVNEPDGSLRKEEKVKPELKNPTATIHSESNNSSIRAWYARSFYVYGYHTVKYTGGGTSRDVFYVNKIKL